MYEDLDKFCDNLSDLTIRDLVENLKTALKILLGSKGRYFVDEESRTLCGVYKDGNKYACFRLEGKGHHFTRSLARRIRKGLDGVAKEGLPIEVSTKECFWNERVEKLLRLTGFSTVLKKDGYYISVYGEEKHGSRNSISSGSHSSRSSKRRF